MAQIDAHIYKKMVEHKQWLNRVKYGESWLWNIAYQLQYMLRNTTSIFVYYIIIPIITRRHPE